LSAAHRALNRGKRSITLNLKHPEGVDLLRTLVHRADVLIESFRPGVMARLGVGYEQLSKENPALLYCAITGFGQDGPYRDAVGHDINYLGYGGVLSMTGPPGGPPVIPGVQVGDLGGGGMLGAIGILAALVERSSTGQGRFIDASMLDGVISWLSIHAGQYLATREVPERGLGPLTGGYACYRLYRTGDDRYLTVGALEPQFWEALCRKLDCEDFIADQYGPRERQDEMGERLQAIFAMRTRDEWLAEFRDVAACVGPVNDVGEALDDPQVRHRDMVAKVKGRPVGPGPPLKLSGLQGGAKIPAPGLGEHTAAVLQELGVDDQEFQRLRATGVI
jgi:crotonobetainyl-CoA:carnitine CoA-transferase CaiB-like acyl-CoA transferase